MTILKKIWKEQKEKTLFFFIFLFLDFGCGVVLYLSSTNWSLDELIPTYFFPHIRNFNRSTGDVLCLVVLRVILLPILTYIAVKPKRVRRKGIYLSLNADPDDETKEEDQDYKYPRPNNVGGGTRATIFRVIIFLFLVACEIHVGIKCIVFHFDNNLIISAVMMSSAVAWINGQLWLIQSLIDDLTEERRSFVSHIHPLSFQTNMNRYSCVLCRVKIAKEAWTCRPCKFFLCLNCAKKNETSRAEGALRTDKGITIDKDISSWMFIKLGFQMAKPHSFSLFIASFFLLLTTAITLLLPK